MPSLIRRTGPFAWRNPRLYVLFTLLYNARAYYPVLAVLFTDLGLTLDQYVMLNAAWAASIFLLEVPSGALADTIGRKRLLVFSMMCTRGLRVGHVESAQAATAMFVHVSYSCSCYSPI